MAIDNPWLKDDHESVYAPCRLCHECGNEMSNDEWAFEVDTDEWVCWDCFMDFVNQIDAPTLAEALDIRYKEVGDIE